MEERTCGGRRWPFARRSVPSKPASSVGRLLHKPLIIDVAIEICSSLNAQVSSSGAEAGRSQDSRSDVMAGVGKKWNGGMAQP